MRGQLSSDSWPRPLPKSPNAFRQPSPSFNLSNDLWRAAGSDHGISIRLGRELPANDIPSAAGPAAQLSEGVEC